MNDVAYLPPPLDHSFQMDKSEAKKLGMWEENHKLLICGLPHDSTYATVHLCEKILRENFGQCLVVPLIDMADEELFQIASTGTPVLFWSDCVKNRDIAFAQSSDFPIIVLSQPFSSLCQEYMNSNNSSALDTIRFFSASKIGCWYMSQSSSTRTFLIAPNMPDAENQIRSIVNQTWEIPIDAAAGSTFESCIAPYGTTLMNRRSAPDQELADNFFPFYDMPDLQNARSIRLPASSLYNARAPHPFVNGGIELLGPARCLTFGPYLYIPAGHWQCTVTFTARDNQTQNDLGFDIAFGNQIVAEHEISLNTSGKFEFTFHFDVTDPFIPFEFRTHLTKGALEGFFCLQDIMLVRLKQGTLKYPLQVPHT